MNTRWDIKLLWEVQHRVETRFGKHPNDASQDRSLHSEAIRKEEHCKADSDEFTAQRAAEK